MINRMEYITLCIQPQECNPHAELAHIGDVVNLGPKGDITNVGLLFHLPMQTKWRCEFHYNFIYLIHQYIKDKR